MVSFFLNMSLDEFESYIEDCYRADMSLEETIASYQTSNNLFLENEEVWPFGLFQEVPQATLCTQKFYYSNNSNYLYLSAYTLTASGVIAYTGSIRSVGWSISSYPGYSVNSYSVTFGTGSTTALVTFGCTKYLSEYVTDATAYTLKVTFTAGAGDIYLS